MIASSFSLSYSQLLSDLYTAYYDARRHKRNKPYQLDFEKNLQKNLESLAHQLYNRTYSPGQSLCFVIEDPKKREVFAADFRDRVVHHLYYNYTYKLFERGFIADSYSCIKNRGTHYGINRLKKYIRQESLSNSEEVFVLKMDISGYFMHINRQNLLKICLQRLSAMRYHKISKHQPQRWNDILDFDFIEYLSRVIILLNPAENCRIRGKKSDWHYLPKNKSLFLSPKGCGLPIGNLTSQLFSNVYLSEFDNYVKRTLKVKRYGRYVDDFYIVSCSKDYLQELIPKLKTFLEQNLMLSISSSKTQIFSSNQGVEFLGAFIKPFRTYVSNFTLNRLIDKIPNIATIDDMDYLFAVLNSYLGILSHFSSYKVKRRLFYNLPNAHRYGYFVRYMVSYRLFPYLKNGL